MWPCGRKACGVCGEGNRGVCQHDLGLSDEELQSWQAAGFYAIAYDTPHGTVISYRGTDNPDLFTTADGLAGPAPFPCMEHLENKF